MKLNIFKKLPGPNEKGFTLVEVLVVVGLLGILAAVVIPNVIRFMHHGEEEAKRTEWDNIQSAVAAMMVRASVHTLDASYTGIDTDTEVHGVTATSSDSTMYYLDDYLHGGEYPLKQTYSIASDGEVSVE